MKAGKNAMTIINAANPEEVRHLASFSDRVWWGARWILNKFIDLPNSIKSCVEDKLAEEVNNEDS